ncbi:hypothetical protein ABKN59_009364 [Abortiporus biennis]
MRKQLDTYSQYLCLVGTHGRQVQTVDHHPILREAPSKFDGFHQSPKHFDHGSSHISLPRLRIAYGSNTVEYHNGGYSDVLRELEPFNSIYIYYWLLFSRNVSACASCSLADSGTSHGAPSYWMGVYPALLFTQIDDGSLLCPLSLSRRSKIFLFELRTHPQALVLDSIVLDPVLHDAKLLFCYWSMPYRNYEVHEIV